MSAIEANKHFEALSNHYFIGHRKPSDRAWRLAEFRAALHMQNVIGTRLIIQMHVRAQSSSSHLGTPTTLVCLSSHLCAQPQVCRRSTVIPAHLHGVVRRAICSVTACSGCCAWKTTPHCGDQKWIAWMEMLRFAEGLTIPITNHVAPIKSHWGADQGPQKIAILRVKQSRDHM